LWFIERNEKNDKSRHMKFICGVLLAAAVAAGVASSADDVWKEKEPAR
jgi:hypothetical protein